MKQILISIIIILSLALKDTSTSTGQVKTLVPPVNETTKPIVDNAKLKESAKPKRDSIDQLLTIAEKVVKPVVRYKYRTKYIYDTLPKNIESYSLAQTAFRDEDDIELCPCDSVRKIYIDRPVLESPEKAKKSRWWKRIF